MTSTTVFEKTGIIILAAGGSTRLGSPKQLLKDKAGISLIRRTNTIAHAISCNTIINILGANYVLIRNEITDFNSPILINDHWESGIASSIVLAVKTVCQDYPQIEALLFLVCDQPFVNKQSIESIILQYSKTGKPIVASHYRNILGTPALFHRSYFQELVQLKGDRGAGKVIQNHMEDVSIVEFSAGIFDIDTMKDYELFIK